MGAAVLGAGSWGTALAIQLCRAGHAVTLWARNPEHARAMTEARENRRYLPSVHLPHGLTPTADLQAAAAGATSLLVCAVPSHAVRETMGAVAKTLPADSIVCSATKGIEEGSLERMSTVIDRVTGSRARISVLAGPSFAREVADEMPTVVTAAAVDLECATSVQHTFASPMFRVYASQDPIGAEIGGAVKNVIAIAAGVADGLGLGHNTRAALLTRGLAEINRLAIALGADPRTVSGLTGMGDLVLTCTGDLSRNRRVGLELGRGRRLAEILDGMDQVAEGVRNTALIDDLARSVGVEMPITAAMRKLLDDGTPPREAIVELMTRRLKSEF